MLELRFFIAVNIKSTVFSDVTPCNMVEVCRRFGRIHLHGRRASKAKPSQAKSQQIEHNMELHRRENLKSYILTVLFICEMWGSHSGDCEDYCRLQCDGKQSGRKLLTFRRNLLPPPSGLFIVLCSHKLILFVVLSENISSNLQTGKN
jgi:hypothetical protein